MVKGLTSLEREKRDTTRIYGFSDRNKSTSKSPSQKRFSPTVNKRRKLDATKRTFSGVFEKPASKSPIISGVGGGGGNPSKEAQGPFSMKNELPLES